jgi:hypothetical protein
MGHGHVTCSAGYIANGLLAMCNQLTGCGKRAGDFVIGEFGKLVNEDVIQFSGPEIYSFTN